MRGSRIALPRRRWHVLLGLVLLALAAPVRAQDAPPASASDPAFERYVDLAVPSFTSRERTRTRS